jgi:hypothetical protein
MQQFLKSRQISRPQWRIMMEAMTISSMVFAYLQNDANIFLGRDMFLLRFTESNAQSNNNKLDKTCLTLKIRQCEDAPLAHIQTIRERQHK